MDKVTMDDELDEEAFNLVSEKMRQRLSPRKWYKRKSILREVVDQMMRLTLNLIGTFYVVNMILMLMTITVVYVVITVNHIVMPIVRSTGLW